MAQLKIGTTDVDDNEEDDELFPNPLCMLVDAKQQAHE